MLEPRCRGRGRTGRLLALAVAAVQIAACGDNGGGKPGAGDGGPPPGTPQKVLILHTNDIHSHLMGFAPEIDYTPATPNDDATVGGMARLASAIGAAKASAAADGTPVLLLDAGDFMMGTLFEFLATQASPELTLMQALGYDATTIGNHELDWTPHGLAGILNAAIANGVTIPILSSNMNFSTTDPGDDELAALAGAGVIQPKLVKMVGGLKVGFFGLLGANAVQVTPQAAPLTFDPIAVAAARMVKELRETDQVDLVVALSHSGIDHDGQGEDAVLAAQVPGIDVIVSGHTHDTLAQPAKVGNTLIVTAGAYTAYLGELALTVTPSGTPGQPPVSVTVDSYTLLNIDDTIAGDPTTQAAVDSYIAGVDTALAPSGLAYEQVVATTAADLPLPARQEAPVGNLVTDAYLNVTKAVQPTDPPAIAVDANGALRAPIIAGTSSKPGKIWLADLFRVTPLGIGPDQIPGYSLVTFYLNAQDIRNGLELSAAPEVVPDDFFLQVAGLKVTYDMTKPLFGRVASLTLETSAGEQPLDLNDTTTCYKVVTTSYVAGLLGAVQSLTDNLLEVTAKDSDCLTPVDPTTRFVDADPTTATVEELKHWQAVLKYVSGLPDADGDGIPDIPAAYASPQGRIVVQP